ncbi:MAG: DUF1573 domain-containing protein [Armatimonadota bacterium]|nr:DUF1573 domain-containing protein [Armatimonadota bacterium]MDR7520076.1 DUF1573 domain-containing protein [Armatimonadota bacterium]MDR7549931.1 DUF1573 domain-containing protein [Armatimonadota bacterium]
MSRRTPTARRPSSRHRRGGRPGLWLAAAAAVIAMAGGYLVASRWLGASPTPRADLAAPTQAGAAGAAPALRIAPPVYQLGEVSQAKGVVTVDLTVTNAGAADLVITEMETSCGCTRAALIANGRPGPWFGMRGHGEWPVGWSARLGPGQRATLRVQYDPDAHGIYRGPIDRLVVLHSNDPRQPRAQVRLTGTQVP